MKDYGTICTGCAHWGVAKMVRQWTLTPCIARSSRAAPAIAGVSSKLMPAFFIGKIGASLAILAHAICYERKSQQALYIIKY